MPCGTLDLTESDARSRDLRESVENDQSIAARATDAPVGLLRPPRHDELRRQMLAYNQRYDMQTGLLNDQSFQDSLGSLLRGRPPGQQYALVWIDVLNLRREFSLRGSKGSEAMVRHIAGCLRSAVDPDTMLGRYSGSCFLIALPASKFDRADRRRIQAVVDALVPMRLFGSEIKPEVAAGVAFYPIDTESHEELVRYASLAATRASQTKSSTVVIFQAGMNNLVMHDHQLEVEMEKGLDQGQFSAYYQPKMDLATGKVLGAEALIRWNHPTWGPVAPGEFIPIAERSRLIHRFFDFNLRAALQDAQRWHQLGVAVPVISVNASTADLLREDLARSIHALLVEFPIAPTELEIEVTESVLFDDEDLFTERVRQLKSIGVCIAIDDFGTRYTGFNVLRKLPLNTMKIDRCFIQGIDRSQDMRALCQTIVAMARQLKMVTVGEGIEEPGELEVMREIGCDAGQGYLLQRPTAAEDFPAFLRDWPNRMRSFDFRSLDLDETEDLRRAL